MTAALAPRLLGALTGSALAAGGCDGACLAVRAGAAVWRGFGRDLGADGAGGGP